MTVISLTGCGTDRDRLAQAFKQKETAQAEQKTGELVDRALEVSRLPPQPAECGVRVKSGVEAEDALDVALEKTDSALYKANNRIVRCHRFNEQVRSSPNS